ncbi:MAG: dihydrodipicolinate synthase family protein [Chthonomonadales bacterium]
MPEPYTGLFVATLTPFDAVGRLDPAVVAKHTEFLIGSGVRGVCPCGTTGEFLYLSLGEKARLYDEVCAAVSHRVPVIAGIWALTPREIGILARAAEAAGADAVFLPPPIYYPASDAVILQHYAAVREACGLPVFAYNIPAYAGNAITLDCLEKLVEEGIVAGIKDSSARADHMARLVEQFGDRIAVMAASDSFATEGRRIGAHGFISALANIWPAAFRRLWGGEQALQAPVDAVRGIVKKHGGIPALKELVRCKGFDMGASRLPYSSLTAEQRAELQSAFAQAAEQGLE